MALSARTGEGIDALRRLLQDRAQRQDRSADPALVDGARRTGRSTPAKAPMQIPGRLPVACRMRRLTATHPDMSEPDPAIAVPAGPFVRIRAPNKL